MLSFNCSVSQNPQNCVGFILCHDMYVIFSLFYLVQSIGTSVSPPPISGLSMSPPTISPYATILSERDDQFGATLNASTSDAGTQMEVRFGQFEKVSDCIHVTLETLFRYTWVKLVQLQNA